MSIHDVSNPTPGAEWLTLREAAELLPGVTVRTMQRWASRGSVPSIVLPGGHRRFRRSDVEALLSPAAAAPTGGAR